MRFLDGHRPALRPDLQRRLHRAEPLGRGVALRRRLVHQRRLGHHHPGGGGQHDRGRRDGGWPRRWRAAAALSFCRKTFRSPRCSRRWSSSKAVTWLLDTPVVLAPDDSVSDAIALIHKRAHGVAVVVFEGRPIGLVSESSLPRRGPLRPSARYRDHRLRHRPGGHRAAQDLRPARARPDRCRGGDRRRRHAGGRADPHRGDPRRASTPRPPTRAGGCASARRSASTATWAPRPGPWPRPVSTCWSSTPRTDIRSKTLDAIKAVASLDLGVPLAAGNVVSAEGTRDLLGAGATIVKVGVGPGAMCTTRMMTGVGRPQFSAVLECASAARATRRTRVGRRRDPPSAGRGAGAGRRGVQRDDRVVVRRHLRVPRRPDARPRRPAVQGELRHGVQAGGGRPHRRATAPSTAPARRCSRKASRRRGWGWTPTAAASRTCSTTSPPACAAPAPMSAPSTLAELHERAVVGVQSAAGFAEGHPLPLGLVTLPLARVVAATVA